MINGTRSTTTNQRNGKLRFLGVHINKPKEGDYTYVVPDGEKKPPYTNLPFYLTGQDLADFRELQGELYSAQQDQQDQEGEEEKIELAIKLAQESFNNLVNKLLSQAETLRRNKHMQNEQVGTQSVLNPKAQAWTPDKPFK
ncbi:MAG: hypothetical protein AAGI66_05050 [Cyanobacteria bacterium P01_H01_bin.74]